MKKLFTTIISVVLILSLTACGTYQAPVAPPESDIGGDLPSDPNTPTTPTDPSVPDTAESFTVSVIYNGEPFTALSGTKARWSDGFTVKDAEFDESGVASVKGLDGDYSVTLIGLPSGFTYNPNVHKASNTKKHTAIEIFKLGELNKTSTNNGKALYREIILSKTGYYRVTLNSPTEKVFLEFAAKRSGAFSIESWVSTADNTVDPKIDMYKGTAAGAKYFDKTLDTGGASSSYTTNFRFLAEIDKSNLQYNSAGAVIGGVVYTFAVYASSNEEQYPVTVDFAVQYEGTYEFETTDSSIVGPKELPQTEEEIDLWWQTHGSYNGRVLEDAWVKKGGKNILDASRFKLNPNDGYYHLYDEIAYPESGGWGPILYARITTPTKVLDESFTTVEYRGNKALTVSNGTENYKLFIEGYAILIVDPPSQDIGPYFCNSDCPCYMKTCGGSCTETCTKCLDTCRHCPDSLVGAKGYSDYANSDGLCPVTDELQKFLQKFAESQRLFRDGNGVAELHDTTPLQSNGENQWLFACCYYK